jgi:2-keto-4-pentenoate hydratase/2-oxohepta-3-ene-1,7-dioic acid hydratase in catechol pathway
VRRVTPIQLNFLILVAWDRARGACYRTGMRFLRVRHSGDEYFASLLDDATARLWTAPPWQGGRETDRLVPLARATLLPPVTPSKIVCVGRNYRAHAAELGNDVPKVPLLFLKPPSALGAHGGVIVLPPQSARVEHEGELAVVIGKPLRRASPAEAAESVFGVTCANDVTARDLQKQDVQFTRAKGFDTFCPCGPWIETLDPLATRTLVTRVNGVERQRAPTSDMIFSITELLSFASNVMTLEPGDLVLTGTPAGVGPLAVGDRVEVEIERIGVLASTVAASIP